MSPFVRLVQFRDYYNDLVANLSSPGDKGLINKSTGVK